MKRILENLLEKLILAISLLSFCGALVYRFYSLNIYGVIVSIAIFLFLYIFILYWAIKHEGRTESPEKEKIKYKPKHLIYYFSYLIFFAICFFLLFKSITTRAIISPWQVTPPYFFLFYGLATIILVLAILKNIKNANLFLIMHYFLSFSVALIVYKNGYGFDSFIHQATVDLINKNGLVDPKPFYYLGQYSLIIIFHKIFFIPLVWLDKLLVPVLAAVTLPLAFKSSLKKWFTDEKILNLTILGLLILPFTIFIVTTPQNLAFLFLLLIIILGIKCCDYLGLATIYSLALAALVTQPIAGIPTILFVILLNIYHADKIKFRKILYLIIFIFFITSLPLAFYITEKNNTAPSVNGFYDEINNNTGQNGLRFENLFNFKNPNQENFILNFIYLFGFNFKYIIFVLIISGLYLAWRHKKECPVIWLYLSAGLSLLGAYFLTAFLPFNFLITYERENYTNRILTAAIIFLLPFIFISLYAWLNSISWQKSSIKNPFLIFIAILISVSLYLSYPRYDHYYNSRGFSTGENDIKAVKWINNYGNGNYIVLANQQVSAAALREYGFNKYYKENIFYYPIPTGGPLYQYYLEMVYKKPSRETMAKAMDLAGVNEGYFVLNKYWWAFEKILAEAKLEAASWEEIDKGEIYIFKYLK